MEDHHRDHHLEGQLLGDIKDFLAEDIHQVDPVVQDPHLDLEVQIKDSERGVEDLVQEDKVHHLVIEE